MARSSSDLTSCSRSSLQQEELVDLLFYRGPLEESRIHACPQRDRIHKDKLAEIRFAEQALLHQLIRLCDYLPHIRHIPVPDVRAENRPQLGVKRIHFGVKGPGIDRIVCLTAKVEMWHE